MIQKSVSKNLDPGKNPGAGAWRFKGKEIHALSGSSTKFSIIFGILFSPFKHLDNLNARKRLLSLNTMALFEAHESRLQVTLLKNASNANHKWKFYIGFPDSKQKGK